MLLKEINYLSNSLIELCQQIFEILINGLIR